MQLQAALALGLLLAGAGAAAAAAPWPGDLETPEAKLWRALEKAGAESVSLQPAARVSLAACCSAAAPACN